jgi:membrane protease YdiL (CAAX protease family)
VEQLGRGNVQPGEVVVLMNDRELRPGWRIARVVVIWMVLAVVLALSTSLMRVQVLSEYVIPVSMILAVSLCLRLDKWTWRDIGLSLHEKWVSNLLIGMAWGAASVVVVVASLVSITGELSLDVLFQEWGFGAILNSLLFYLLVALGEEILFRGYAISVLQSRLSTGLSLVVAAGIFTLIHVINPEYYWFAFVYAFLMGLLLGTTFVRTGSLWYALGFHFAWNFLQSEPIFNLPGQGGEAVFSLVIVGNCILAYGLFTKRAR